MIDSSPSDPNATIDALAARQHGVVTRRQLLEAGVSAAIVRYRVERRRLVPLHRGVYRVGPVRAALEREAAAVMACGPTAHLSHQSAARVLGMRLPGPVPKQVHVTVVSAVRLRGAGVRVHRVRRLGGRSGYVPGNSPDERRAHAAGPVGVTVGAGSWSDARARCT